MGHLEGERISTKQRWEARVGRVGGAGDSSERGIWGKSRKSKSDGQGFAERYGLERENWYGEVQLRVRIVRLREGLKKGIVRKGLQRMRDSHRWDW